MLGRPTHRLKIGRAFFAQPQQTWAQAFNEKDLSSKSEEIDTRLSSVGVFLNPQFPNTNFGLEQRGQNNEIFPAPLLIHEPEIEGAKVENVGVAERLADPANCP
jgi:hypothetical protein